jgi:hypothetical protein
MSLTLSITISSSTLLLTSSIYIDIGSNFFHHIIYVSNILSSHLANDIKEKTIEIMKTAFDPFVSTRLGGMALWCKIFDTMDLKERKKFIQGTVSGRALEFMSYNPNAVLLGVKIIACYDDAKNIKEFLFKEVATKFKEFLKDKDAAKFLIYVFSGELDIELVNRFRSE